MATVRYYRLWCESDKQYEYVWGQTPPTMCPTDTSHDIDIGSIVVDKTITEKQIKIKEEQIATGGNFGSETIAIRALKNSITSASMSWPYPISALAVEFISENINRGDSITLMVGKNTITGIILANAGPDIVTPWMPRNYFAGQVVQFSATGRIYTCIRNTDRFDPPIDKTHWRHGYPLYVSPTVIDNTMLGFIMNLFDGRRSSDMGRVIGINKELRAIYVENAPTDSFIAAGPTYVRQTVKPIRHYEISGPWQHVIGSNKIGGSYVPTDVAVTMTYQNNSVDTDKNFVGNVEYLY
jgi:hypothetical protein